MWNCPMQSPYQHGAWFSFHSFKNKSALVKFFDKAINQLYLYILKFKKQMQELAFDKLSNVDFMR